jgi:acyl-CoA synthetase (NDP forming)
MTDLHPLFIPAPYQDAAESGRLRRDLQKKLLDKVRGYGMRMVGPNCMGLLNTDDSVRLNASFSQIFPPPGRIAMSSQSGALGLSILELATELDLNPIFGLPPIRGCVVADARIRVKPG